MVKKDWKLRLSQQSQDLWVFFFNSLKINLAASRIRSKFSNKVSCYLNLYSLWIQLSINILVHYFLSRKAYLRLTLYLQKFLWQSVCNANKCDFFVEDIQLIFLVQIPKTYAHLVSTLVCPSFCWSFFKRQAF